MRVLFVLRKKLNKTQLQLATDVGITQTEVSNAENGFRVRKMAEMVKIFAHDSATKQFIDADFRPDDLLLDWDEFRDKQRGLPVAS